MRIHVLPDPGRLGELGAGLIVEALAGRTAPLLGVATGSSPEPIYAALAERLPDVDVVSLDEYIGLPLGHVESYREVVRRTVIEPCGLNPERLHTPDAWAPDPAQAALAYDEFIAARGGADIQILGLGHNGHIAFNEPGSALDSRTRVVELTDLTRSANARFFPDDPDQVPTHAITQGVGTILSAARLLLVATGESKAEAVEAALAGPVTTQCPGSAVQTHPHVTVLLDPAAASLLPDRLLRWDVHAEAR